MAMMNMHTLLQLKPALISVILLAVSNSMAQSAPQAYCSSDNTGSSVPQGFNRYQSMGACSTTCRNQSYAFAILQGSYCWCSDYIPAEQSSTSDCNAPCPGYPSDICGNQNQGLFGYVALGGTPSGTAGASPQSQTSSQPPTSPSPSPPPQTSYPASTSSTSSDPPTSSSTAALTTSTSSVETSSNSPTVAVHTSVITRSNSVVTQTITTTPIIVGGDSPQTSQMQRNNTLSSGAIAGIVIGTLLGLAALIFAAFLLWRRKKNAEAEDQNGTPRPKRTTSVLSRTGLLSRNRPISMAEHHNLENDPYAAGQTQTRPHSMMFGAGATIEPSSPLGGSQDNVSSSNSRRLSKPMVYDQRLNPSALFANPEANGSRVSMQDQQDYSRPLGVANPDFIRASFDSR